MGRGASYYFSVILPGIAYLNMRLTAHHLEVHYKTDQLDGNSMIAILYCKLYAKTPTSNKSSSKKIIWLNFPRR